MSEWGDERTSDLIARETWDKERIQALIEENWRLREKIKELETLVERMDNETHPSWIELRDGKQGDK